MSPDSWGRGHVPCVLLLLYARIVQIEVGAPWVISEEAYSLCTIAYLSAMLVLPEILWYRFEVGLSWGELLPFVANYIRIEHCGGRRLSHR